jgi:competence protein ComEC
MSSAGFTYAIVKDVSAFPDECGRADLIVARVEAPTWCAAKTLIDPARLAAHGVHWLRWDATNQTFEVREAAPDLARPWRIGR